MMLGKSKDLQIVLNEMFASKDELSLRDVRDWQEKYPEYKREIAEAYADWREFEFFILKDEEAAIIDEKVSEADKSLIEKTLAQLRTTPDEVITNLRETAEKQGVARARLPGMLGVSETLMRKLERRNLKEIPRTIQEKLAAALRLSVASVQTYFALSSTLPPAARYKSKSTPQTKPKQTFAEAVRQDPELSEAEKSELLKLQ